MSLAALTLIGHVSILADPQPLSTGQSIEKRHAKRPQLILNSLAIGVYE
jgi:hypothetical protein